MPVAELLIEEIKTLPEETAAQVLDFVGYLKEKAARNAQKSPETDDSWFERGEECPICAAHRDPVTGNPRYKPEVYAGMQEVEDMISGKIPSTLKQFSSLDEMLADLRN
jgi:hypothetical protein